MWTARSGMHVQLVDSIFAPPWFHLHLTFAYHSPDGLMPVMVMKQASLDAALCTLSLSTYTTNSRSLNVGSYSIRTEGVIRLNADSHLCLPNHYLKKKRKYISRHVKDWRLPASPANCMVQAACGMISEALHLLLRDLLPIIHPYDNQHLMTPP